MSRPLCSVVMATYNRAHLLRRSLEAYRLQYFDSLAFELVVIDDRSTDGTERLVRDWAWESKIRTVYVEPMPKLADWRDCGAILNHGIRASSGHHILLTHPEVIPGRQSVRHCVDHLREFEKERTAASRLGMYAACRVYYLSPRDQEWLDLVPWKSEGNLACRQIPQFYDEPMTGNLDYRHEVTDRVGTPGYRIQTWDSWVFGGCSRETWKRLGGMVVSQKWGSVDILFNHRRKTLGVEEVTCKDDETIVVHQNHDGPGNVPTDRDMEAWKRECEAMDLKNLRHPKVDELGW